MSRTYLRGDLYYADFGMGVGSEQNGCRPVMVVQNDTGNRYSPTVIVAAVTSRKENKVQLPVHYHIGAGCGLERPSVVLLEQIRTLDKQRLGNYIGRLAKADLEKLDHRLMVSLGLDSYIPGALTMCLCGACADNFRAAGIYTLRRANAAQMERDVCTYCGQRRGYDYIVKSKE